MALNGGPSDDLSLARVDEVDHSDFYNSETDSSDDGYDYEPEITLKQIKKSLTVNFPIRSTYTSHWESRESFRELVQNWRDGIISAFNLPENDFDVIREERCTNRQMDIVYKVLRPNSEPKEWLGYIRFYARDGMGTIDITNRRATLQPKHLDMGGTTKSRDRHQAGAHGEGLKIALLGLQRSPQNHCVRAYTGAFSWSFNFSTQGKLVARLRRMTHDQLSRAQQKSTKSLGKGLAPFAAAANADVQFLIGQKATGRDQQGIKKRRDQVSLETFNWWCSSALFLQQVEDGGMVNTKHGSLIIDEKLRGNLYLKGLLLRESTGSKSACLSGKPLKYGYNFQDGVTDRERRSMASARENSRQILAIWNKVLLRRRDYVSKLSDMLNSTEPVYADVAMAKDFIKPETVLRLKDHLFSDASKWYFSPEELADNPQLKRIIHGLGRDAEEIQNSYWEILEAHKFVRTAAVEQQRRFLSAEVVSIPNTTFAQELDRLIRASFHACPQTSGVAVQFVDAGQSSLHLFYVESESLLKIHDMWLCEDRVSRELGLLKEFNDHDSLFHAVKQLFHDAIRQIPLDKFPGDDYRVKFSRRRRERTLAEQRIIDYLQVKVFSGLKGLPKVHDTAHVFNTDGYEALRKQKFLTIQVHLTSSCSHLRERLLAKDVSTDAITCNALSHGFRSGGCFLGQREGYTLKSEHLGKEFFSIIVNSSSPNSILVFTEPYTATETSTVCARRSQPSPRPELGYGKRLTSLDLLEPRDWFEATKASKPMGNVVIGVPKDEEQAGPSRKRKRAEPGGKHMAEENIIIE